MLYSLKSCNDGSGKWLVRYLLPMWPRALFSMIAAIVSGVLAMIDPLLIRRLIDIDLPEHHQSLSLLIVLAVLICLLGRSLLLLWSNFVNFTVQQDFGQILRISILSQLQRLSADYHEATPVGEKLTRLENDVDQVAELGSNLITSSVRAIVLLVANMIVMLKLDASITMFLLPAVAGFLWIRSRYGRTLRKLSDSAQAITGRSAAVLNEYLAGILQIQLLGAELMLAEKAAAAWKDTIGVRRNQRSKELQYAAAVNALLAICTALVLGFGSYLTLKERLTLGGLVAFYTCATRVFEPVAVGMDVFSKIQRVGASIRRIRELLEVNSTVEDSGTHRISSAELKSGITLESVGFRYGKENIALQNISVRIDPAASLGVVGPSGCGKSTLAKLLVRLVDPYVGCLRLDGRFYRDYALSSIRAAVCYVPQSPLLFNGTIRDNLSFANRDATAAQIDSALEVAQLSSLLERLPKGAHTEIGPGGYSLSGGEKQRIAIARALLRGAPVLVLDESTSALDGPTEQLILRDIAMIYASRNLIVISHRLLSISWMNRIIVLDRGRVIAVGNHTALFRECDLYRYMFESHKEGAAIESALQPSLGIIQPIGQGS
ncbi:MAG: Methionine transporter ATP-binding protein [Candidatus Sulfotelmatobacter sp.]|nr:Methionine transporter ATP-binding protein [Candidatus Sulfotelmatobacter sp.]